MSEGATSIIADGIIINGKISGDGNLIIKGCLEGEIELMQGDVSIIEKGFVEGQIQVKTITIGGEVRGKVKAKSMARILPSGIVNGDVETVFVDIQEGATVNGKLIVSPPSSKEQDKETEKK